MTVYKDVISLFGGTSFLGQELISDLIPKGWSIYLFTLNKNKAESILKSNGLLSPKIKIMSGYDKASQEIIESSYFVLNLMQGPISYQNNDLSYQNAFKNMIEIISKQKGKNLIHLSCLGANSLARDNLYLKEKGRQEDTIRLRTTNHTILRTGLLFGKGDVFFNHYADYFRFKSVLYLPHEAKKVIWNLTYVGDVALAISKIINQPDTYTGHNYNLYDERSYQVFDLMKMLSYYTGFANCSVTILPKTLLNLLNKFSYLTGYPKTASHYESLMKTNFLPQADKNDKSFIDLNIKSTSAKEVMPFYLFRN